MTKARLKTVQLPDFGMPDSIPSVPLAIYRERAAATWRRAEERGVDVLVVYADREHSANLAYLTGFDPRFEEALLILGPGLDPAILVGNECYGMAAAAPLPMRRHRCQDFSLPGQPRDRSEPLTSILASEGIGLGRVVGVIGWKTYAEPNWSDLPAYLIDTIRGLVGREGEVRNATDILIDAATGLRVINEVEQLAAFEYAACHTSDGVRRVIFGLKEGMSEREAVRLIDWNGLPLSCHLMLSSGPRASLGLLSPGDRRMERGDRFTVAFGQWGALNCRAGFLVAEATQLSDDIRDYVERLVAPYFEAVAEWYATLRIGVTGGELQAVIDRHLGESFFGIFLNPGHQIHLDEWVNSPVFRGSKIALRSGMALQVDVIPATGTDYFTSNIEDGVALADETLRAAFAEKFPAAWTRIEARRRFMREALGIDIAPDVLPFSNIPAYLPPLLLQPNMAMTLLG
jgi:hypothetical protein